MALQFEMCQNTLEGWKTRKFIESLMSPPYVDGGLNSAWQSCVGLSKGRRKHTAGNSLILKPQQTRKAYEENLVFDIVLYEKILYN